MLRVSPPMKTLSFQCILMVISQTLLYLSVLEEIGSWWNSIMFFPHLQLTQLIIYSFESWQYASSNGIKVFKHLIQRHIRVTSMRISPSGAGNVSKSVFIWYVEANLLILLRIFTISEDSNQLSNHLKHNFF